MRLVLVGLALTPGFLQAQRQDFTLRGTEVVLYNIAGRLSVEGGAGDAVRVEVTRQGADAGRLRVEAGPIRGRETLRVIYPEDRVVYREAAGSGRRWGNRTIARLRVADDGTFEGGWDGWRGGQIEVVTDGRGLDAAADIRVIVPPGKALDLNLAVGEATVSNVQGDIRLDVHAASITTSRTRGRLDLDTGSGGVRVTDAEGDVRLDTGSGNVTVSGVKGRELRLDTGSGAVTASSIEVDELGLDTGSGRVTLRGVRARDLMVDTGSGSVEIELAADIDRMGVDSGSGGITIVVPSTLGAEVVIETGSGAIDVDVPLTVRRSERRYLQGRLGDGRGRMSIETGSGGVRVRAAR
ncbi:MAG: DUF4097 family beta strand repeat-containing protein [Gemmatimonadaceae bacterium]